MEDLNKNPIRTELMNNGTKLDPALTTRLTNTDMMTIGGAKGLMLQ